MYIFIQSTFFQQFQQRYIYTYKFEMFKRNLTMFVELWGPCGQKTKKIKEKNYYRCTVHIWKKHFFLSIFFLFNHETLRGLENMPDMCPSILIYYSQSLF